MYIKALSVSIVALLSSMVDAQTFIGGQNAVYIPSAPIQIVNPATQQISGSIPTSFVVDMRFSLDGKLGYAIIPDFGISIIDLQTGQVTDTIQGPWNPQAMGITADSRIVGFIDNDARTVVFVNMLTKQVLATTPVGMEPSAIAFTPNGLKAYVTDHDEQMINPRVYAIDMRTFAITKSIPTQNFAADVAVSADGRRAYVVCEGNPSSSFVQVIDTQTDQVIATIPVLVGASSITLDREGQFGYVSTGGNSGGGFLVLDLHRNTVVATVLTGNQTFGGRLSQNEDFLYGVNIDDNPGIVVMDTKTRQIVTTIPTTVFATHVATPPLPGPAIRPANCVVRHGANRFTAYFGYLNNTGAAPTIASGPDNNVSPGDAYQGQPTLFQQGLEVNSFHVDFDGSPLTWSILSPVGSTYWTTASRLSPFCL